MTQLYLVTIIAMLGAIGCKSRTTYTFNPTDVPNRENYRWNNDTTILVFSGNMTIPFKNVKLEAGKYEIQYKADGSSAEGLLPRINVFIGEEFIKNDSIKEGSVNLYTARFEIPGNRDIPIQFEFYNDYHNETQDRNIYMHFPVILKEF